MVRLRGFKKLLNVDEALEKFINESKPTLLGRESIPINEAYGRVLASDVKAEFDIPPSDRSTMDGYAIRSRDVIGASVYSPKRLKVVDEEPIKDLEAKRVWTGNPIPKGSDAVIELERTRPLDGEIEVLSQVTNVSMKGESIRRGEVAVKAGSRLKPHHLGLLASLGLTQVDVARKPRVAILSTGDELVKLGEKTSEGKTIDSNKLILSSMCSELGAEPVDCGIARDDFSEISSRIDWGVKNADIVITSGGTSVGEHDLVPLVIEGFEEGR
ncbi:MAG: molybdopterin molybdotransferase MoeA, partial [Candidatus Bathyarchaeia archaeon]